jgi:hypothetical protein
MGEGTTASGRTSTALGWGIEAAGDYSVAIALNDQKGAVVSDSNTMAIMGGEVGIGTLSPTQTLHVNATMRLEPQATAPTCNENGMLYVDTSGALCYCDGGTWNLAAGGGACT